MAPTFKGPYLRNRWSDNSIFGGPKGLYPPVTHFCIYGATSYDAPFRRWPRTRKFSGPQFAPTLGARIGRGGAESADSTSLCHPRTVRPPPRADRTSFCPPVLVFTSVNPMTPYFYIKCIIRTIYVFFAFVLEKSHFFIFPKHSPGIAEHLLWSKVYL
jgi:hypothetical protein